MGPLAPPAAGAAGTFTLNLAGGVAGVVVIGVDVDVGILEVVVLRCQIDVVGSSVSGGHSCCV